jgi:hypothetical protein
MEYAVIVAIDTMHGHPLRCIPQAQAIEHCVQRRRIEAADRSSILLRLARPFDRYADIVGLAVLHLRELGTDLGRWRRATFSSKRLGSV